MQILKYHLTQANNFTLELPVGAKVLSVQNQHEKLTLWALSESRDSPPALETRRFSVWPTGVHFSWLGRTFLSTVQFQGGDYVVHVFEDLP